MTPLIAVHMSAALGAVAIGPIVLWARLGTLARPWLHRALGYAWSTLMVITAGSAIFIRDYNLPNMWGFSPIHLLIPVSLAGLFYAFRSLARRELETHRRIMQTLYFSACLVTGAFTLLPSRHLGQLIWHEWLGWL